MNKKRFDILPEYINKNIKSSTLKHTDTTMINDWIIYVDGKHNYESINDKFWCKPKFIIRPQLPNIEFKSLLLKLSIPSILDNKLTIKNNDELLFASDVVDKSIEIRLKYKTEYVLECLPFYPADEKDKRVLGAYISYIKILTNENFIEPIHYKNMVPFYIPYIKPFIV